MVSILPVKPTTARASRIFLLIIRLHGVWCTQGLRPWCHTFSSVLRWPVADHLEPWTLPVSLCWWLIYGSCRPAAYTEPQSHISTCIDHVAEWMRSNRLQLNAAKTDNLWSATSRRLDQLPQAPLRVGTDFVTPSAAVPDVGIHLDSDMSMSSHVRKTVSTCFAVLRQLRSIRCSVSRPVVQSLVTSLVHSRLD